MKVYLDVKEVNLLGERALPVELYRNEKINSELTFNNGKVEKNDFLGFSKHTLMKKVAENRSIVRIREAAKDALEKAFQEEDCVRDENWNEYWLRNREIEITSLEFAEIVKEILNNRKKEISEQEIFKEICFKIGQSSQGTTKDFLENEIVSLLSLKDNPPSEKIGAVSSTRYFEEENEIIRKKIEEWLIMLKDCGTIKKNVLRNKFKIMAEFSKLLDLSTNDPSQTIKKSYSRIYTLLAGSEPQSKEKGRNIYREIQLMAELLRIKLGKACRRYFEETLPPEMVDLKEKRQLGKERDDLLEIKRNKKPTENIVKTIPQSRSSHFSITQQILDLNERALKISSDNANFIKLCLAKDKTGIADLLLKTAGLNIFSMAREEMEKLINNIENYVRKSSIDSLLFIHFPFLQDDSSFSKKDITFDLCCELLVFELFPGNRAIQVEKETSEEENKQERLYGRFFLEEREYLRSYGFSQENRTFYTPAIAEKIEADEKSSTGIKKSLRRDEFNPKTDLYRTMVENVNTEMVTF